MKLFKFTTERGAKIELQVNERPVIEENYVGYTKSLKIEALAIDDIALPKTEKGNIFLVKFDYLYLKEEKKLAITIEYDAFEHIKKAKKIKTKEKRINILCSQEVCDYYNNVFIPAADEEIERLKSEKLAILQAEFDKLDSNTIITIHRHSSHGYNVSSPAGKHQWFKSCFEFIEKARIEIANEFITDFDYGDYSISHIYKMPFGELKKLYEKAKRIIEPIEKANAVEKEAREKRRNSLKLEVLKKWKEKIQNEGIDIYAHVKVTDPGTGETLEFICKNIFDFGYVIKPNYPIFPGAKGGMDTKEGWEYKNENIPYTDFERRCVEYLTEFAPITTMIRL